MLIALGVVLQATAATEEELLALHEIYSDAMNAHNAEEVATYFHEDAVYEYLPMPPPLNGRQEIAAVFASAFQAFPDWHVEQRRIVVSGNIIVTECTITGTHLDEWAGIPATGKTIQTIHMDVYDFEGDKIKHKVTYDDSVSLMIQLGLMPVPKPSELVPSFTLPDPEATGLAPLEAAENLVAVYNTHDVETYAKLVHLDAEILLGPLGVPMNRDEFIASLESQFVAYSALHQELVRLIDMGDGWVLGEVVFSGTNDGPPYPNIPATGNSVELRAAWLVRIDADGLMTNIQVYWDELTQLTQLGLFPPPEVPEEDYSNVFFMSLSSGLNMISLPLKPIGPYTARSFAEELGATVVIKFDETRQRFVGFTLDAPDDGFAIEGGKGYIVNVPESKVVAFIGAAWTNQPPVEAAPPSVVGANPLWSPDSVWAFVVSGKIEDGVAARLCPATVDDYLVTIRNTRTNAVATDVVREGYFAAAFADLNRKNVVQTGDRLELQVRNQAGEIVSDTLSYIVTTGAIRQAFSPITLKNVFKPRHSMLLQNYPNPFNPETWIPYQISKPASVVIRIYNATGMLVHTLDLGHTKAGSYLGRTRSAYWDGKNDAGEKVASGVYFYHLKAGDFAAMRRMVIVK